MEHNNKVKVCPNFSLVVYLDNIKHANIVLPGQHDGTGRPAEEELRTGRGDDRREIPQRHLPLYETERHTN